MFFYTELLEDYLAFNGLYLTHAIAMHVVPLVMHACLKNIASYSTEINYLGIAIS